MKADPDFLVMGWTEGQRQWLLNGHRSSFLSHRTDPKPRPEGYRDPFHEIPKEFMQGMWEAGAGMAKPWKDGEP